MLYRLLLSFLFVGTSLFALENNKTIVLSTVSNMTNANTFIKRHLTNYNKSIYVIKSKRGFYMVTTGAFSKNKTAFDTMKILPLHLKEDGPFIANLDYSLMQPHANILKVVNPIETTSKKIQITQHVDKIKKQPTQPQQERVETQKELKPKNDNPYIDTISLAYGRTNDQQNAFRFGLQKGFGSSYFNSEIGHLTAFFDTALSYIDYDDNLFILSLSPVVKYNFKTSSSYKPYLFAGIGAAFLSDTAVEDKVFSTSFQFEDRIGLGITRENINMELGYYHYSNASIKTPNDGIDAIYFSSSYNF